MKTPKKFVAVKLAPEMHADVQALAKTMHSSVSAVIRMAIERQISGMRAFSKGKA